MPWVEGYGEDDGIMQKLAWTSVSYDLLQVVEYACVAEYQDRVVACKNGQTTDVEAKLLPAGVLDEGCGMSCVG